MVSIGCNTECSWEILVAVGVLLLKLASVLSPWKQELRKLDRGKCATASMQLSEARRLSSRSICSITTRLVKLYIWLPHNCCEYLFRTETEIRIQEGCVWYAG